MSELSNEPTLAEQIGTLSGDTPLNGGGGLGEVTFDSSGPGSLAQSVQQSDPMAKLHIPELKQNTTTTVTTNGGGPGQPQAPGQTFNGADLPQNGSPGSFGSFARKFIGVPYVWGGTSPNGFDCSGFTQYVYAHFGVKMPRISADQARSGPRVSLKDLRPGDLVAVDNSSRNNGADHVGIYLGNGLVIDAPRPGRSVEIAPLGAFGGGWGVRVTFPGQKAPRRPRSLNPTANKPKGMP